MARRRTILKNRTPGIARNVPIRGVTTSGRRGRAAPYSRIRRAVQANTRTRKHTKRAG